MTHSAAEQTGDVWRILRKWDDDYTEVTEFNSKEELETYAKRQGYILEQEFTRDFKYKGRRD